MLFAGGHAVRARAETGDQQAYEAAMKCYIVAANASLDRRKAGDEAKSVAYETKAHGDFDLAVKFGRSAGHNGANIEADILETQGRELPKLVKDVTYNRQSAATCKALGLL
jgi:hypothetical protein